LTDSKIITTQSADEADFVLLFGSGR